MKSSDFLPWLYPADAHAKGVSIEQLSEQTAKQWREGLAQWGKTARGSKSFAIRSTWPSTRRAAMPRPAADRAPLVRRPSEALLGRR